jgi:hypothetical protein
MQFDMTIQYGMACSRSVTLQVSEKEILRDVALRFAAHFPGELDSKEFLLVTTKVLKLSRTVAQNDLSAGAIVTAVVSGGWKVKLKGRKKRQCGCQRHNCIGSIYGPNIKVNENAVRPVFRIGGRTCLYELFVQCDEEVQWVTGNLQCRNFLWISAGKEWLWQCCKCGRVCFTCTDECEPYDTRNSFPWQNIVNRLFCGVCYVEWTNTLD